MAAGGCDVWKEHGSARSPVTHGGHPDYLCTEQPSLAVKEIDGLPEPHLLRADRDALLGAFVEPYRMEPIELHVDQRTRDPERETTCDPSRTRTERHACSHQNPVSVAGHITRLASSPDSNRSVTMSQPPTSLPSTLPRQKTVRRSPEAESVGAGGGLVLGDGDRRVVERYLVLVVAGERVA